MGEEHGEDAPLPVLHRPHRPVHRRRHARGAAARVRGLRRLLGEEVPDPQDPETFAALGARPGGGDPAVRELYRRLLALRARAAARRDPRAPTTPWRDGSAIAPRGRCEVVGNFGRDEAEVPVEAERAWCWRRTRAWSCAAGGCGCRRWPGRWSDDVRVAGAPVPARGHLGRARAPTSRSSPSTPTRVELCLFDAEDRETRVDLRERTAFNWHGYLPDVGPGQRYGFRVHGAWAPERGPPLQPPQAADRPLREGDRGARSCGTRPTCCPTSPTARTPTSCATRPTTPTPSRRAIVVDSGFDWEDDRPPATPVERDPDLRGPRQGLHQAAPRRARGPARHLRGPGVRRGDRPPALARRHRRRAAAGAPQRRRAPPGRARASPTTGATARSASSRPTPCTRRPGAPASRCASSRAW